MLDRKLPDCERGRSERRLIHEPLEEIESRGFSAMGCAVESVGLFQDWRLEWPFWLPSWEEMGRYVLGE